MAEPLVSPDTQSRLAALSAAMEDYRRVSGKESAAVLVQKGGQLIYGNQNPKFGNTFDGLAQLFIAQAPEDGAIWAAARARGFRLGRKAYGGALSPRALARAKEMMGGFKTILASVNPDTKGVRFVRRGVKKARVFYRHGRKSAPASGDFVGPLHEHDKRLNLRAVATIFELQLRTGGRRFLGAGWLHRRFRKLAQSDPRRAQGIWRISVNQNPRSTLQPLGTAGLEGDEKNGNLAMRIVSHVPGVLEIGEGRGLFRQAIEGVTADLGAYMERKHAELLQQALDSRLGKLGQAIRGGHSAAVQAALDFRP